MRNLLHIAAFLAVSLGCACGQMIVLSAPLKDPEVKPEQRTATIAHYEQTRATARGAIRVLSLALQNSDSSARPRLNEAINNEQDIVDSANWCIQALRDKTAEARGCMLHPDSK